MKDGWYKHINYFSELSDSLRHAISLAARDEVLFPSLKEMYRPFELFLPAATRIVFLSSEPDQQERGLVLPGELHWSIRGSMVAGKPGSHAGLGWEQETIRLLTTMSESYYNIVWVLLGTEAVNYSRYIDAAGKHLIVSVPLPDETLLEDIMEEVNHYLEKRGRQ